MLCLKKEFKMMFLIVREGNDVTGTYNYVNPAGALVTVNYEAGVNGFSQTRDVKQGAVQMRFVSCLLNSQLCPQEHPWCLDRPLGWCGRG